ncbi:MAG TPA: protein TolA, partial [Hyphomicrobiaceae bacterium]|nr:protein TolA [Hyphomicrobiaceae bacterium]
MYFGLAVSLALHAALLGWALISIHTQPPLKMPELTPVEVAVISENDLVRLRQGDRSSKNLEAEAKQGQSKEPPKTEPVRPPPPPPPPAASAPPPP